MVVDGEEDSREGGGGGKRPRSPGSPEIVSSKSSKLEQQGEQHCSVFSLEKGDALVGKNNDTQGETPGTSVISEGEAPGTPVTSGKKVVSPNRLDLLKECVDGNKLPRDKIDCSYLYKLICGLEWRLHNLEEAHAKEISELKAQHASDIASVRLEMVQTQSTLEQGNSAEKDWLVNAKRELPLISEGLAKVETSLEGVDERVKTLEQGAREDDVLRDGAPVAVITDPTATIAAQSTAAAPAGVNLVAMDTELKRVGAELNNVNKRAKQQRRRAHLLGDQRDQYSRRETLRLTGVPYNQGENTNQIMIEIARLLGVNITEADISVSHRSGRRGGRDPRPILCKFIRRDVKNRIMDNRKLARNIHTDPYGNPVRIFVDEDLTRMRASVLKKLRQERVPHYTRDGKVFIANGDSATNYSLYDSPEEWEKLPWSESVKIEVGVYPKD